MSNLAPIWQDNERYSPRRMDAKNITRDTGSNIVAISSTRQLGAVCPTDTSGGLVKNVLYICDYDAGFNRVAFIPVFGDHLHDGNAQQGGALLDIQQANSMNVVPILTPMIISDSFWNTQSSGTGAQFTAPGISNDAYLEWRTGATTGNYSNARLFGPLLSWVKKIIWQMNLNLNLNNNLLVRAGINVDKIQDTQDTARRQMGIEGCDGHGTNWVIINGNGNSSSLTPTPTSTSLSIAGENNYKLVHTPATECRLFFNGVSIAVSSTNVASTGDTFHDDMLNVGVKLTTGTSEKILKGWHTEILSAPGTGQLY